MKTTAHRPTPDKIRAWLRRRRREAGTGLEPEVGRWHHLDTSEVLRVLDVSVTTGLDEVEVGRRRERWGQNRITPRPGTPGWLRFLQQLRQPLVYLLLIATLVTVTLRHWVDASVIFGVVFINAIVGFIQESKAEGAIEALDRLVTTLVTVRRGTHRERIPADELVPGDVVLLDAGDRVGADLRLFRVRELQVDESALTGESAPVAKQCDPLALDTVLADRKNLAFAGTLVTRGQGEGVVWATGDRTEMGRIAWLVGEAPELATPLTRKIAQFSRGLLWAILGLALVTFLVGIARGQPLADTFMAAVALAVGAIPEGLPAAVTIVLAIGVGRMARRGAVIRKLPAVETLGGTTVICSDKTGTLTQNQMTVREIFSGGEWFEATGTGYEATGELRHRGKTVRAERHPALIETLVAGTLCNDSRLVRRGDGTHVQGDPTELALLIAGEKGGVEHIRARREAPVLDAIPFESAQMFRATLHPHREGRIIYKVGAVERVLERCHNALAADGTVGHLDRAAIHSALEGMAARGLRVLACARRLVDASQHQLDHGHVASGLTFLGLQGMLDPPRAEAIAAVRHCQEAGIAVKMITGDHVVTAKAIGRQMGLQAGGAHGELVALSGRELDRISDRELPEVAARTAVFARVAPEQKLRLVRALQARGAVVAMTGDGVNDAPALKQANIGIAMGLGGTDVAKNAAAMVLTDDNFATIAAAVEEGRGIFDNLTKFIVCTLPTNGGEAMILLGAILAGTTLPALPVQLLWVNLTTSVLIDLALVFEPKEPGLMRRPPRAPERSLLTRALLMRTGLVTLLMTAGAFWLFASEMARSGGATAAARTAVINVIVLTEIFYLFNCRSLVRPCFRIGFWANPWAIGGALALAALQALFTYAPVMNRLFHTAPIGLASWARIGAVAATVFATVEIEKWIRFGATRGKGAAPE